MIHAPLNTEFDVRTQALADLWRKVMAGFCPSAEQFNLWLVYHSYLTVVYGIKATGLKYHKLRGEMEINHQLAYASKVMNTKDSTHASSK